MELQVLLALMGGMLIAGLIGLGGEGGDEQPERDDEVEEEPMGDVISDIVEDNTIVPESTPTDPVEDPVYPEGSLIGTDANDILVGDTETIGIFARDGDDLIFASSAEGVLDAGDGKDVLVLTEGTAELTGGNGGDVFLVFGKQGGDEQTIATISDFDPNEDSVLLYAQQRFIGAGQVEIGPENISSYATEVETEFGPALQLSIGPIQGFEPVVSDVGYPVVNLLGVSLEDLQPESVDFRIDVSQNDEQLLELFVANQFGNENYDNFGVGTFGSEDRAVPISFDGFNALSGSDLINTPLNSGTDLFGGSGDDILIGVGGVGATFNGGPGDDSLNVTGEFTLTGGDGTDSFRVTAAEVPFSVAGDLTIITDFEPRSEVLTLVGSFPDVASDAVREVSVELTPGQIDGVSGVLAKGIVILETSFQTVDGPVVFLQGVNDAEIPSGALIFEPQFTG